MGFEGHNIIEKIIIKYLISYTTPGKVFYASLLTAMKKQECNQTPTMGVTIDDGQLFLLYNQKWVDTMIEKEGIEGLKGVIEHELLHIVYDHLTKVKMFNRVPEIYNMASDMAINQLIDKQIMPKAVWIPDKDGNPVKGSLLYPHLYKLPEKKDSEYYYNELMKNTQKIKVQMQGQGQGKDGQGDQEGQGQTLDDHELWRKIKGSAQMNKEVVKKAVKEAYEYSKKLKGDLPYELEQQIKSMLKPPTISWRQLLKRYIGASIKTGFKSSWKRPNRRFPNSEELKGKVSNRTIRMLLAVDTSGSVSDKDFVDFMVEMKGILNVYKCTIDVLQCDADLHGLSHLHPYSQLNIKFKGRGGTEYKPVFKYLQKHMEYDLLIYFTDLYCGFEGCKSNRPVIWVCTKNGDMNNKPPFGRVVQITKTGQGQGEDEDDN